MYNIMHNFSHYLYMIEATLLLTDYLQFTINYVNSCEIYSLDLSINNFKIVPFEIICYYNIFYYNWAMHVSLEQVMEQWQYTSLCPFSYVEYWKWDEIFTRVFCMKWWDNMCVRRILMKITLYVQYRPLNILEYFKEQKAQAQASHGEQNEWVQTPQ